MNVGFFGGTFDPIHKGHMAVATAAKERFQLSRIYFVPANVPPHKDKGPIASYIDRYAMVALATGGEKAFLPSLLEGPGAIEKSGKKGEAQPNYSIDTVRKLKRELKRSDRLYFLIGIDAFKDIAKWREADALFAECEFIVASRPGYSLADVANSLPEKLRPPAAVTKPFSKQPASGDIALSGVSLHLLEDVKQDVSATMIREAARGKKSLERLVGGAVAEYIKKMGLYRS